MGLVPVAAVLVWVGLSAWHAWQPAIICANSFFMSGQLYSWHAVSYVFALPEWAQWSWRANYPLASRGSTTFAPSFSIKTFLVSVSISDSVYIALVYSANVVFGSGLWSLPWLRSCAAAFNYILSSDASSMMFIMGSSVRVSNVWYLWVQVCLLFALPLRKLKLRI